MFGVIHLYFAFVLFVIAAIWNPEPHRHRLVSAGLACWVPSLILGGHI